MKPLVTGLGLPAALVAGTLRNPDRPNQQIEAQGIVGAGSDLTLIPQSYAQRIGLQHHSRKALIGVDGLVVERPTFIVDVEFADTKLERRSVATWNEEFVILGRDVLDEFVFVYDGKARQFEIHDP
jgi:hypothetical protein